LVCASFVGEAGEWYSAVLKVEFDTDEVYSNVKYAKAKSTGTGEYDLRFGVIADTHVGWSGWMTNTYPLYQRLEKVLDWYNTEDVNALAIVGDIVNNGTQSQWNVFKNSWEKHKGTLQLIAVLGNHEVSDGQGDNNAAVNRFEAATGQKVNAHYVINGYHFIVLSEGAGSFIDQGPAGGAIATGRMGTPGWHSAIAGDEIPQILKGWIRARLDIAKADAPGKPIFMFLHRPISNTFHRSEVSSTSGFGRNPLTGFFKDDSEVVFFSGHAHISNNEPRSIWQEGFTSVHAPTTRYIAMDPGYLGYGVDGVTNSQYPKIAGQAMGQGIIVSSKDSKVTIENYDFDFSEGRTPLGNVVKLPQIWEFDVTRPVDFPYTKAKRDIQKTAPVFDETKSANADIGGIKIKKITDTTVEVEFPQAKIPWPNYGNEEAYSYRFDFINLQTGLIDRSANQWSDFMLTPRLQKPTYTQLIGGLKHGTNYELRIYAYGSFQERSSQYLTCTFRTSGN
jgi:predicted phosphodiesterase